MIQQPAIFQRVINGLMAQKQVERRNDLRRNLIRREAKIGGRLFGPVEPGRVREFFCLDEYTWVWHEEWTDQQGQRHKKVTHYDLRPDGVIKLQNGQYQPLSLDEVKHLQHAIRLYRDRVDRELYAAVPR